MTMDHPHRKVAQAALLETAAAIRSLGETIDSQFDQAIELILSLQGRLVVCGVGKSGHIGRKIAATLASTGTPSFFMHPTEAMHGDLGMLKPVDAVLLISHSGETEEILRLLPALQRLRVSVLSLTGSAHSTLARHSVVSLSTSVSREICPHNLAPTTSTTAALALGDALAVALATARNFKPEDFAERHPGGTLGRRLLSTVKEHMARKDLPVCAPDTAVVDVLRTSSQGRLGIAVVCDASGIRGVITDGDLRRGILRGLSIEQAKAADIMNPTPLWVAPDCSVGEAEDVMFSNRVKSLLVSSDGRQLEGIFDLYRR